MGVHDEWQGRVSDVRPHVLPEDASRWQDTLQRLSDQTWQGSKHVIRTTTLL